MKLVFKGKYNGDPESLPNPPHQDGAIRFREFKNLDQGARMLNIIGLIVVVLLLALYFARRGHVNFTWQIIVGMLLSVLVLVPHEIIHALLVKDTAYIYHNLRQGLLFVFAPETMSKRRFIILSLLPNIIFGFIPYVIALLYPAWEILGAFGALSLASGVGDLYNVINALTQVPRGARIYMHGINSYWFWPTRETAKT